jgi:hypothetical protein
VLLALGLSLRHNSASELNTAAVAEGVSGSVTAAVFRSEEE